MSILTNEYLYQKGAGAVDLANDTIKAVLLDNTYTQNKDHTAYSDVSGSEVSGTGYTAGGKEITGKAWVKNNTGDYAWLDCDDLSWSSITVSGVTQLALIDTTVSNLLIGVWDINNSPLNPSNGTLDIQIDANGLLRSAQA